MNPNQPDKENNPNDKPCRVLHNPHAPRAKKPRQANAAPNPCNGAPTTTAEFPTPTNPTLNTNNETTPTTEAVNPDQNSTSISQSHCQAEHQGTKVPNEALLAFPKLK